MPAARQTPTTPLDAPALSAVAESAVQATTPAAHEAAATAFVLQLGTALHAHGFAAHRLEAVLHDVSLRLGLEAQFFSTPTSLMAGFGPQAKQHVHLLRIEPGSTNLGHLARLDRIARDVLAGRLDPVTGSAQIDALLAEPPRWSEWQVLVAFVAMSVGIAVLRGVRVLDMATAALLGFVSGVLVLRGARVRGLQDVAEPVTATVVSTLAFALARVLDSDAAYTTTIAGLVVLLPGMQFTTGIIELSTRHLASGTARLSGALVTFLGLGFGVALGSQLGGGLGTWLVEHGVRWTHASPPLPTGLTLAGVVLAATCFTVLLQATWRDTPWIIAAALAAFLTTQGASPLLGDELAAFLGALVVSAGSTLVARLRDTTPIVTITPGLLILVPGSIGLRSITSLQSREVMGGVAAAFSDRRGAPPPTHARHRAVAHGGVERLAQLALIGRRIRGGSWHGSGPVDGHPLTGSLLMLRFSIIFFVLALIAGVLGFGGMAAGLAGIAKILFFVFLVLFVVSLFTRGARSVSSV